MSAEVRRLQTNTKFFFFNDTATTEIYTLSLHDALPISNGLQDCGQRCHRTRQQGRAGHAHDQRSEEHTSELQSPCNLVCRLLLEKKKTRAPEETPPCGSDMAPRPTPRRRTVHTRTLCGV